MQYYLLTITHLPRACLRCGATTRYVMCMLMGHISISKSSAATRNTSPSGHSLFHPPSTHSHTQPTRTRKRHYSFLATNCFCNNPGAAHFPINFPNVVHRDSTIDELSFRSAAEIGMGTRENRNHQPSIVGALH